MTQENIIVSNSQNVLIVEFNRPKKKNSITSDMYLQMAELLNTAASDNDVNVLLFQGSEDCFTAGNDLSDFSSMETGRDEPIAVVKFLQALTNFPKPMIAAVTGVAVGIGTTLLLHCDLVYADKNSRFSLPFVHLGLCAEAASSLLLPLQVGYRQAAEWLLLGEQFSAEKALTAGLINQIPESDVRAFALKKAQKLSSLSTTAIQVTRKLLKQSTKLAVEQTMKEEFKEFTTLLQSDEVKNIVANFFKK